MNIENLPDDILRILFQQFSIQESISCLRIVCKRWKFLIEMNFRAKKSLKLFGTFQSLRHHIQANESHNMNDHIDFRTGDEDCLVLNLSSWSGTSSFRNFSLQIVQLFPNVNRLMLSNCVPLLEEPDFLLMLEKWSPNFVSLAIIVVPSNDKLSVNFWSTINTRLPALRRLHLNRMYHCILPNEMKILGQLTDLTLNHYRGDLVPILSQLGSSIEKLQLIWCYLAVDQMKTILETNPILSNSLKQLTLEFINSPTERVENYRRLFQLICERFQALKFLDILYADQLPLGELISNLSKLSSLTELWVYIGVHQLQNGNFNFLQAQLPQILVLFLELHDISEQDFFRWIPALFPNVECMTLKSEFNYDQTFKLRLRQEFVHLQTLKLKCL